MKNSTLSNIPKRQDDLFVTLLETVPFTGWTAAALAEVEAEPGEALLYFPDGIRDAIAYLPHWADAQLQHRWEAEDTASLKVREKITAGVRWRLEALAPYEGAVRAAIPHVGVNRLSNGWQTLDLIWKLAGDTATDFNYYSKRGLLALVYSSTFLYWLQDTSEHKQATWEFLDRRIAGVLKIPGKLAKLKPSNVCKNTFGKWLPSR